VATHKEISPGNPTWMAYGCLQVIAEPDLPAPEAPEFHAAAAPTIAEPAPLNPAAPLGIEEQGVDGGMDLGVDYLTGEVKNEGALGQQRRGQEGR
jgi:hypothetical protein